MKLEDLKEKDITSLSTYEKVVWQMSQEPFVVPCEKDTDKVVSNKDALIILFMIVPLVVCHVFRCWHEYKK